MLHIINLRKISICLVLFFSTQSFGQQLVSDNIEINNAFKLAVQTVDINTRRGILAAGGDYGGEWTRDIAINSWNAASLLRPAIAEKSLWSVTVNRDTVGHQYWDKILWVIAARNHYLATGDKIFLKTAYACSAETMKHLELQVYDQQYGLFRGPSVFNDGIAAYPEPIYEPANNSSSVLDHRNSALIKCLSTNSIYYGAYLALGEMANVLNIQKDTIDKYTQKATVLKQSILKNFYDPSTNTLAYLIDQNGKLLTSQEALGISFAVIFGIVEGTKAQQMIDKATVSKYGITSVTPDFARYSSQKPGRHNNIIWPMVNGFFAQAAARSKSYKVFSNELYNLAHLALDEDKGDYNFREVYNPYTGKPDGGWQANGDAYPEFHWESLKLQTWSATAYLSMVLKGLIGINLEDNKLSFSPCLPDGITKLELKYFKYRNAILDIAINGKGHTIKSFYVDGKRVANNAVAASLTGMHSINIQLY